MPFNQRDAMNLQRYENAAADVHADLVAGRISQEEAARLYEQIGAATRPLMERKQAAEQETEAKQYAQFSKQNAFQLHLRQMDAQYAAENLEKRVTVVKDPRTGEDHHVYIDDKGNPQTAPWQQARYDQQEQAAQQKHEKGLQEVDPAGVNLFGAGLLAGQMPGTSSPEEASAQAQGGKAPYGSVNWTRHDAQMAVHQAIQRQAAQEKAYHDPKLKDLFPQATEYQLNHTPPNPWQVQQALARWKQENQKPPERAEWMKTNDGIQGEIDRVFKHGVAAVRQQMAAAGPDPVQQQKAKEAETKRLRQEEVDARKADKEEQARRDAISKDFKAFAKEHFQTTVKELDPKTGQPTGKSHKETDWAAARAEFHKQRALDHPEDYEPNPGAPDMGPGTRKQEQAMRLKPYQSQLEALLKKRKAEEDAKPAPNTGFRPWSQDKLDEDQTEEDRRNFIAGKLSRMPGGYTMKDYDEMVDVLTELGKHLKAWKAGRQQQDSAPGGGTGGDPEMANKLAAGLASPPEPAAPETPAPQAAPAQAPEGSNIFGRVGQAAGSALDYIKRQGWRPTREQEIEWYRSHGYRIPDHQRRMWAQEDAEKARQQAESAPSEPPPLSQAASRPNPASLTGFSDEAAREAVSRRPARGSSNLADYVGPNTVRFGEMPTPDTDTAGATQWLKDRGYLQE